MTTKKVEYSVGIGILKTFKNSSYLLIPFGLAILAGLPAEYAWITGPVVYFLKNLYENKKFNSIKLQWRKKNE